MLYEPRVFRKKAVFRIIPALGRAGVRKGWCAWSPDPRFQASRATNGDSPAQAGSEKILRPRASLNLHVSLSKRFSRVCNRVRTATRQVVGVSGARATTLMLLFVVCAVAQPEYLSVPPAAK